MPLRILNFTPLSDDFGLEPLKPLSLGSYLTPRIGDIAPATTPIAPLQPSWQGWSGGIDRYGSFGEMLAGPATTPGYIEQEPQRSIFRQQYPIFPEFGQDTQLQPSQYPTSAFQQTLKPPPRILRYEPPPAQPTTPLGPTTAQSFFKPPTMEPPPKQLGALYPGLTPTGKAAPFFTPLAPYEKYPQGPSLPGPRTAAKIGEALPEEMTVARSAAEALADYDLRRGVRDALGLPTFKSPAERERPKWDPLGLGGLVEGGPPGFVESTLRSTGDVLAAMTADPRRLHEPWIPPSQRVQPGIGPTPWQAKTGWEVLTGERGLKGWTQDTAVELARGFVDLGPAFIGSADISITNATKGITPGPVPSGLFTAAVMEQLKKYGKLPTGGDTWLGKYFSKVTPPAILDRLYAKEAEFFQPGVIGKSVEDLSKRAFGGTHEDLDKYIKSYQTDASRIAQEEVGKAATFLESVKKLIEYPSAGVLSAIRALPMMYVGQRLGVRVGMGPLAAGVTSEGGFAAGGIAEQARQDSPTGYTTTSAQAIAALSGGITSAVTYLSGRVASHFGLGDPDTMFAAAQLSERAAMNVVKLFFWTAHQEGMEEVIQNSNETIAANIIAGRPLMQGVGASAPMSYFTGVLMAAPSAAMAATPADYEKTKADAAKVAGAVKSAATTSLNLVAFGRAASLPVDPMIRERVREIEHIAMNVAGGGVQTTFPLGRGAEAQIRVGEGWEPWGPAPGGGPAPPGTPPGAPSGPSGPAGAVPPSFDAWTRLQELGYQPNEIMAMPPREAAERAVRGIPRATPQPAPAPPPAPPEPVNTRTWQAVQRELTKRGYTGAEIGAMTLEEAYGALAQPPRAAPPAAPVSGATPAAPSGEPPAGPQIFVGQTALGGGRYGASIGSISEGTKKQLMEAPDGSHYWSGDYREVKAKDETGAWRDVAEGDGTPALFATQREARAAAEATPQDRTTAPIPPKAPPTPEELAAQEAAAKQRADELAAQQAAAAAERARLDAEREAARVAAEAERKARELAAKQQRVTELTDRQRKLTDEIRGLDPRKDRKRLDDIRQQQGAIATEIDRLEGEIEAGKPKGPAPPKVEAKPFPRTAVNISGKPEARETTLPEMVTHRETEYTGVNTGEVTIDGVPHVKVDFGEGPQIIPAREFTEYVEPPTVAAPAPPVTPVKAWADMTPQERIDTLKAKAQGAVTPTPITPTPITPTEGGPGATQTGQQPEGSVTEHPRTEGVGPTTEAGRGDRAPEGGQKPEEIVAEYNRLNDRIAAINEQTSGDPALEAQLGPEREAAHARMEALDNAQGIQDEARLGTMEGSEQLIAAYAALSPPGAAIRWLQHRTRGITDEALTEAISQEFGISGGLQSELLSEKIRVNYKGGKNPELKLTQDSAPGAPQSVYSGAKLVALARTVLDLPEPAAPGAAPPTTPAAGEPPPAPAKTKQQKLEELVARKQAEKEAKAAAAAAEAAAAAKKITTPGTDVRWGTGLEWATALPTLTVEQQRAHVFELASRPEFIAVQSVNDLRAMRGQLLRPGARFIPPKGSRQGSPWEQAVKAVQSALALKEKAGEGAGVGGDVRAGGAAAGPEGAVVPPRAQKGAKEVSPEEAALAALAEEGWSALVALAEEQGLPADARTLKAEKPAVLRTITRALQFWPEVLADAQAQGYTGDIEALQAQYAERIADAVWFVIHQRGAFAESSDAALVKAIIDAGGIKSYDLSYAIGRPPLKVRDEYESIVEGFRKQGYFGQRAPFRDTGLALDEMMQKLRGAAAEGDTKAEYIETIGIRGWPHIGREQDLMEELDRISRGDLAAEAAKVENIHTALGMSGVITGTPWWETPDGAAPAADSGFYDEDPTPTQAEEDDSFPFGEAAAPADTYIVFRDRKDGGLEYADAVDDLGLSWVTERAKAKPLTKAEVYQAVHGAAEKVRVSLADDPRVQFELADILGYVGQDANDEAIYDPAKAWGGAPIARVETTAPARRLADMPLAELERIAGIARDNFIDLTRPQQDAYLRVVGEIGLRNRRAVRGETADPRGTPLTEKDLKTGKRMVQNEQRRREEQAPLLEAGGALPEALTPEQQAERSREMGESYSRQMAEAESRSELHRQLWRAQLRDHLTPDEFNAIEARFARNYPQDAAYQADMWFGELKERGIEPFVDPENPNDDYLRDWLKTFRADPERTGAKGITPEKIIPAHDPRLGRLTAGTVDILDTGEAQPRLPGETGAVRETEVATPTEEAPFSLTGEVSKATDAIAEDLFGPGAERAAAEPPAPTARQPVVFRSGAGNITDIQGFIQAGQPVGVVALQFSQAVREAFQQYVRDGGHVFFDSGAYNAFMKKLPPPDFTKVLAQYLELARENPKQAAQYHVVAPDAVGDATESRRVQKEHAEAIRELLDLGVNVIVPTQVFDKGQPVSTTKLASDIALVVSNFPKAIIGLPGNAKAISFDQLRGVIQKVDLLGVTPRGFHFLGIGANNPEFERFIGAVYEVFPTAEITSDSNRIRALFGKGRPATEDAAVLTEGRADQLIDVQIEADTTELTADFYAGRFAGFEPEELAAAVDIINRGILKPVTVGAFTRRAEKPGQEGTIREFLEERGIDDRLVDLAMTNVARARMERQERPGARRDVIAAHDVKTDQLAKDKEAIRAERDKLMDKIGKKLGGTHAGVPIDPDIIQLVGQLIEGYIKEGIITVKQIVRRIRQEYPGMWDESFQTVVEAAWEIEKDEAVDLTPIVAEIEAEEQKKEAGGEPQGQRPAGKGTGRAGEREGEGLPGGPVPGPDVRGVAGGPPTPDVVAPEQPGEPEAPVQEPGGEPQRPARADTGDDTRGLTPENLVAYRQAENSEQFSPYRLRTRISGVRHPRLMVEARSLAGVEYPDLDYVPSARFEQIVHSGRVSIEQAEQALAAVQANVVGKHGYLAADNVGVGKAREVWLVVIEMMERAKQEGRPLRLMITSKTKDNLADLQHSELPAILGDALPGFKIVRVSSHKDSSQKGDPHAKVKPLPTGDHVVYLVDFANLADYRQALNDAELHGIVGDEAHRFKNVSGAAVGGAWGQLHADIFQRVPRDQQVFAYFTATPAQQVEDFEYLYGLRFWPIDGFGDWVKMVTGDLNEDEARRLKEAAEGIGGFDIKTAATWDPQAVDRPERGDAYTSRLTPAEGEQITREWKRLGRFSSRDLWRRGTKFEIQTETLKPDDVARYDAFTDLARDAIAAEQEFGPMNEQRESRIRGINAQLQFASKRLQLQPALEAALVHADRALETNHQVVLSLISVSEVLPTTGNLASAITQINDEEIVKQPDGSFVNKGKIQEAVARKAELFERARALGVLPSPIDTIKQKYGADNIAFITGANAADRPQHAKEFQNGDRRVAVISAAGSTGISLDHRVWLPAKPIKFNDAVEVTVSGRKRGGRVEKIMRPVRVGEEAEINDIPIGSRVSVQTTGNVYEGTIVAIEPGPHHYPPGTHGVKFDDPAIPVVPGGMMAAGIKREQPFLTTVVSLPKGVKEAGPEAKTMVRVHYHTLSREGTIIQDFPLDQVRLTSDAGGRRLFIDLQYEWSATEALQRYGRVDRASQVSPPHIMALNFGTPAEKKFLSTIANRMASVGALSKGGSETTGAELEDFELHGGESTAAARTAWNSLTDEQKMFFIGSAFRQRGNNSVPATTTNAPLKKIILSLMFVPSKVANPFWERFVEEREAIRNRNRAGAIARTAATQGEILGVIRLAENLVVYRVVDSNGHGFGILSGVVMPEMPKIRDTLIGGRGELERRYVRFSIAAQRPGMPRPTISGLTIPVNRIKGLARLYGKDAEAGILDTPAKVYEAITAGDKVPLQEVGGNGKPWILRMRRADGKMTLDNLRKSDLVRVQAHGVRYWAAGEWFEVVDLDKFLKQFPTQSQAHAAEEEDEGGSGSAMMQQPPSARARKPATPPGIGIAQRVVYGIPSGPSPTVPVPPETPPPIPIPVSEVSPMEMPEIILFARELDLEPKIVKKFGKPGVLGMFSYKNGIGEVRIHADLFKPGNEVTLAAALGHELGHATDWMPDKTDLKRGNILGRLYSLRKYLSGQFTTPRGVDINNATIRAELLELTREWNPWDEANASDSYNKYRHSSEELYAEGLSAIITNPAYAQRVAPTFFREFFAAMDTKPEVKEAYFGMQQMLSGNRKALVENRLIRDQEMSKLGDLTALAWQERLQQERLEAKRVKAIDLKIEVLDKNHWVVDLARQVETKGRRIPETRDPRYALEERQYLGGKILGWLKRNIHPVWQEVLDAGIDWIDFGLAGLYERVLEGDRYAMANPNASSPAVAKEKYDLLKSMLTPRQRNVLARTLDAWRAAYRDVAEAAYQSGLITDKTWQEMLDNPAYGTFWVIEHMANDISPHIIQQVGTTKPIANVADATLLKALAFIRATEYNNVKRSVFNFLDAYFPKEIEQAREAWYIDKNGNRTSEPLPPNGEDRQRWKGVHQGDLVLVHYMEDGRLRGKYVDPYIAVALARETIGKFQIIGKIFRRMNSGFFRPIYTTMNLGFQTANAARDFFRFWKAMPKVSLGRAVKLYWQAIPMAKVRAFGLSERPTQEALDAYEDLAQAEEAGILSMPFHDYFAGREIEDTLIEDILARSGVGEFTPRTYTPGNKFTKAIYPVTKQALAAHEALGVKTLLRWIEDTGTFIETLPKAAALIEFKGQGQVSDLTPAQRSHIRRNVGSPDFLMGGTSKGAFNEVFLFSNAMIQGARADYALATAPATRSGWWWRTIAIGILPKMLAVAGQLGWRFGGGDDDDQWLDDRLQYRKISEYDLTNYNNLVLGLDAEGNAIYLRVPQDDSSRLIGGLFWKLFQYARNKAALGDPIAQQDLFGLFADFAEYMGHQTPSLHPTVTATGVALQYAFKQPPIDSFRGQPILTEDEMKAAVTAEGAGPARKKLLGWSFQHFGGGIVWKFHPSDPLATDWLDSPKDFVLGAPVLSNVTARWIRRSRYGETETMTKEMGLAAQPAAMRRIEQRSEVGQAIREWESLQPWQQTDAWRMNKAREIALSTDPALRRDKAALTERIQAVSKSIKIGVIRKGPDPYAEQLVIPGLSMEEKAVAIEAARRDMSPAAYGRWYAELRRQKIISEPFHQYLQKNRKELVH